MKYLDLQDNPWQCDCHNQWIMSYLIPAINSTSPQLLGGDRPVMYCQSHITNVQISTVAAPLVLC